MAIFNRYEGEQEELESAKPEWKKRKRKEPLKPWGKKERWLVAGVLGLTVIISGVLAVSARAWKLPGFPRVKLPSFSLFKGETIIIEGPTSPRLRGVNQEKADRIIKEFRQATKDLSGVYGLYVVDLATNYSFGINENETFAVASLIKLPVMVGIMNQDEKLAELMGKKSDNTAFNTARKRLGDDKINQIIKDYGMGKTSLADNETTPKDIGLFFTKERNNEQLLGFLTETIYEDYLKAGVPAEIRVAHKYGTLPHVINDAGIVFTEKPYVVVILTKGVIEKEAKDIFPRLSKIVYEGMTGN